MAEIKFRNGDNMFCQDTAQELLTRITSLALSNVVFISLLRMVANGHNKGLHTVTTWVRISEIREIQD